MNRFLCTLLLCCLVCPFVADAQKPVYPKSLLWRISGNGLPKDSYLFGSMHLQDKRIFNFTDSLYYYLEKAEGFALEVDMQVFVDSVFRMAINGEGADEVQPDAGDDLRVADSLIRRPDKNEANRRKLLAAIRERRVRAATKGKEMPTVIDGYLYSIARRQGKWLGGVEDVSNQLGMRNEFGSDSDDEELVANDGSFRNMLEQMIAIYLEEDLDKLDAFAGHQLKDSQGERLMIFRNLQMAHRMDSLAGGRSMGRAL